MMMFALLSYPVLLLTVQGGMNGMYFFMLAVALWSLYSSPKGAVALQWCWLDAKFAAAMVFPVVAVFLSQAAHGDFVARAYDGPSRYLLAIPIFMALKAANFRVISVVQYGLPAGAIAAFLLVLSGHESQHVYKYYAGTQRVSSYFLDLIHFGDFALLLGLLSLVSINWTRVDPPYVLLLKTAGFIAGMYASFQTGARGGWLAIPVVIAAWYVFGARKKISLWALFLALVAFVLLLLAIYIGIYQVHMRVNEFYEQIILAVQGKLDSSVGIRLQHWRAAFLIFMDNPTIGVGSEGLPQAIANLQQSGLVTQKAVFEGAGEVHSDILGAAARLGIFGLLSSLALYFVPLVIFIKSTRSKSSFKRISALMGVCFVLSFFTFGLTVEIFSLKMAAAFYGLTLAVLLAGATSLQADTETIIAYDKT